MNNETLTEQEKFLYAIGLAKRAKENFLSDILWAQSLYDNDRLNDFFAFCFPNAKKENVIAYYIERETTVNSDSSKGRNDFRVHTSCGLYVIESKILDTNIDNVDLYLQSINQDSSKLAYIISKRNPNYNRIKKELSSNCINCVDWEDFIDTIIANKPHDQFATLATSVLDYNYFKQKPKLDKEKQKLCDSFFKAHFIKNEYYDKKGGDVEEWEREGGYAYGYSIWASVWFGLLWSPLKGIFWGFAYGNGGKKETTENKCTFKYIKPLGKYFNDGYTYYEVRNEDKTEINEEILRKAFEEFATIINVHTNNKKIPLLQFINYYGTNI